MSNKAEKAGEIELISKNINEMYALWKEELHVRGVDLHRFVLTVSERAGLELDVEDEVQSMLEARRTDESWKDVIDYNGWFNSERFFTVPFTQADMMIDSILSTNLSTREYQELDQMIFKDLIISDFAPVPKSGFIRLEALVEEVVKMPKFEDIESSEVVEQVILRRKKQLPLKDIVTNLENPGKKPRFVVALKKVEQMLKYIAFNYSICDKTSRLRDFIGVNFYDLSPEQLPLIQRGIITRRRESDRLANITPYCGMDSGKSNYIVFGEDEAELKEYIRENLTSLCEARVRKSSFRMSKNYGKVFDENDKAIIRKHLGKKGADPRPRAAALPSQAVTDLHWAVLSILNKEDLGLNPHLVENHVLNRRKKDPLLQEMIFLRKGDKNQEHVVLDDRLGDLRALIVREYGKPVPEPEPVQPTNVKVKDLFWAVNHILSEEKLGWNPGSVEARLMEGRRRGRSKQELRDMIIMRGRTTGTHYVVPEDRLDDLREYIVDTFGFVNPKDSSNQRSEEGYVSFLDMVSKVFKEEKINKNVFPIVQTIINKRQGIAPLQEILTYVCKAVTSERYVVAPENEALVRKYLLYNYGSPKTVRLDDFVKDIFKILRDRFELSDLRQTTLDKERRRVAKNLIKRRKGDQKLADMIPYCDREPGKSIYCVFEEDAETLREYIIGYIDELKQVQTRRGRNRKASAPPSDARSPRPAKPALPAKPDRETSFREKAQTDAMRHYDGQEDNLGEAAVEPDRPDADTKGIVKALQGAVSPIYEPGLGPMKLEGDDFEIELEEFVSELIGHESMDASASEVVSDLVRRMKKKEKPLTFLIKEHDMRTHEFAYGVEDDKAQGLRKYIIDHYAANKIDLEGTTSVLDACLIYIGKHDPDVEKGMMNITLAAVGGNSEFLDLVIFPAKKDSSSWRVKKRKMKLFLKTLLSYSLPYHNGRISPSSKARKMIGLDS